MKQDINLDTLLFPLPAAMISCGTQEESNILTVSWIGTICSTPPMCYISVRPNRFSYEILKKNMEFVINITTKELAEVTDWCGLNSGKDHNKFEEMKLTKGKAKSVRCPIIEEAPINIECRVKEIIQLGSHDMFIAEVLHIQANNEILKEDSNKIDASKISPIVYSFREYYELGEHIGKYGWTAKK